MGYPERFEKPISGHDGYKMEVDTCKWDCSREAVHWHLCKNGQRVGQIWVASVTWAKEVPPVGSAIVREAENLTRRYSSEIASTYLYNKENGSD